MAIMGGTETYRKLIANPFPELIEQSIGWTCVNLGYVNAGVDVLATDPQIVKIASDIDVTVLQLMGGTQHVQSVLYGPPTVKRPIFEAVHLVTRGLPRSGICGVQL
jgi:hypothetical protein